MTWLRLRQLRQLRRVQDGFADSSSCAMRGTKVSEANGTNDKQNV